MPEPTPTIRLTVNGEPFEASAPVNVATLLERLQADRRHTAVERNRQIVPRASFDEVQIADGDVLEIVTLVGGG